MAQLRAIKEAKQSGVVMEATPTVASLPEEGGQEFEQQGIQEESQQIPTQVIQQVAQQAGQYQPQYPQGQRVEHIERMTAVPGSYGIPHGYRVRDDLMTGKKALVPLPQQEAWIR